MFRSIGMIVRPGREDARMAAERAAAFVRKWGAEAFPAEEHPGQADLMMTFGGDGTLLTGAHAALEQGIPLLGFNLGTVGFLTEADPEQLEERLEDLMNGRFTLERRSLLQAESPRTGETFSALNDVVISRGGYARLIRVESTINGQFHDVITADGIIAATPTGSTGYSLSAGGPVIEPSMQCMVLTPVCAHSLRHCPTVVSASSEVRLRLLPDREQTAELQIDGQNRGTLRSGDEILVSGSPRSLQLIRFGEYRFYDLMRTKLTEWGSNPG